MIYIYKCIYIYRISSVSTANIHKQSINRIVDMLGERRWSRSLLPRPQEPWNIAFTFAVRALFYFTVVVKTWHR